MALKKSKKWRCYVCGKPISLAVFHLFLVSPTNETDRAFLVCESSCINKVEEGFYRKVCDNGTEDKW